MRPGSVSVPITIVHCFWLFILLTPLISYELSIIKLFAYFHYLVGVASSEYNFSFTKNDGDFFMLEKIELGLHLIALREQILTVFAFLL
jgi:hypothetical protein